MTKVLILSFVAFVLVNGYNHEQRQHKHPYRFERPLSYTQLKRRLGAPLLSRPKEEPRSGLSSSSLNGDFPADYTSKSQYGSLTAHKDKEPSSLHTTKITRRKLPPRKQRLQMTRAQTHPNHQKETDLYNFYYDGDDYETGGIESEDVVGGARLEESAVTTTHQYDQTRKIQNTFKAEGNRPALPASQLLPKKGSTLKASPSERHYASKKGAAELADDYYYDDEYYDTYDESARQGYGGGGGGYDSGSSGGNSLNPLALLVAPLAGIALLSAAAAVALNPVLVQISLTKRKKRSLELNGLNGTVLAPEFEEKFAELEILEDYLIHVPESTSYQQKLLASYLTCSGYTMENNFCMDRVVCEYGSPVSGLAEKERRVIAIILYNIMSNEEIDVNYKERLKTAAQNGREDAQPCQTSYPCLQLDALNSVTDKSS